MRVYSLLCEVCDTLVDFTQDKCPGCGVYSEELTRVLIDRNTDQILWSEDE